MSASGWSRRNEVAAAAAFAGLITMVLVAQDVPLASYLRRVESERLLAELETRRVHPRRGVGGPPVR